MLIDFSLKLKSHKLPVSIKEYLTLLEAAERLADDVRRQCRPRSAACGRSTRRRART